MEVSYYFIFRFGVCKIFRFIENLERGGDIGIFVIKVGIELSNYNEN